MNVAYISRRPLAVLSADLKIMFKKRFSNLAFSAGEKLLTAVYLTPIL